MDSFYEGKTIGGKETMYLCTADAASDDDDNDDD